jgi:hypothetical protein
VKQRSPEPHEDLLFAATEQEIAAGFAQVVRWASAGEIDLWERSQHSIPAGLRDRQNLSVALPSATQPPGTGQFRLEFWVSEGALVPGALPHWREISAPISGVRILGLRAFGPKSKWADDEA